MSQRDGSQGGDGPADRTLLGVPAPRVESTPDPQRSPVFVRSGTSEAEVEGPLPLPRMALPSRPPPSQSSPLVSVPPPGLDDNSSLGRLLGLAKRQPALWMVGIPVVVALLFITPLALTSHTRAPSAPSANANDKVASAASPTTPGAAAAPEAAPAGHSLAELEAKPIESLTPSELVELAEARTAKRVDAARALRDRMRQNPGLVQDKATQTELLRLTGDSATAPTALGAMALGAGPLSADLIYEAWTGTTSKNDATDLARALVYSKDVRSRASGALAVALDLRETDKCEDIKAILPRALKDGDRRSLHLLTKLTAKRGCGAKKTEDCYACLRDDQQELVAIMNAVKARKPPAFTP